MRRDVADDRASPARRCRPRANRWSPCAERGRGAPARGTVARRRRPGSASPIALPPRRTPNLCRSSSGVRSRGRRLSGDSLFRVAFSPSPLAPRASRRVERAPRAPRPSPALARRRGCTSLPRPSTPWRTRDRAPGPRERRSRRRGIRNYGVTRVLAETTVAPPERRSSRMRRFRTASPSNPVDRCRARHAARRSSCTACCKRRSTTERFCVSGSCAPYGLRPRVRCQSLVMMNSGAPSKS